MIKSSELILNPDGSPYHLAVRKENLSENIILVGDQNRIPEVTKHFDSVDFKHDKREFHVSTGIYQGKKISVISTGIGLDNIDIVLNEVDAAFNIDPISREINPNPVKLRFLRLGTCGGVQPEDAVGTFVLSSFAIDESGLHRFYQIPENPKENELTTSFQQFLANNQFPSLEGIKAVDSGTFVKKIQEDKKIKTGITLSAIGFYGPQGRALGRIPLVYPNWPELLQHFEWKNLKIRNIEMETAAIYRLSNLLGHEAASLSVILANRNRGEFATNPQQNIDDLIIKGLHFFNDKK